MGKYSEIVNAKSSGKPENQITVKPENSKTGNSNPQTTVSSDREVISKEQKSNSGKPEKQITRKPDSQQSDQEDMVNLSIKVPRRLRQKWVGEARLRGSTVTKIISEYLKKELGE